MADVATDDSRPPHQETYNVITQPAESEPLSPTEAEGSVLLPPCPVTNSLGEQPASFSWERWKRPLQIIGLVATWWSSAVAVTLLIKDTVSARQPGTQALFPHPIALTSMTNVGAGLFLMMTAAVADLAGMNQDVGSLKLGELMQLLAIGAMQGTCIGLSNTALKKLTVSLRTVLLSNGPLMQMITARAWGLEALGPLRLLAGLLLVTGGCMQTADATEGRSWRSIIESPDDKTLGVGILLTGMVIAAQQGALTQKVLQHADASSPLRRMSKMDMSARLLPASGTTCLVLALLIEENPYKEMWENRVSAIAQRVAGIAAAIALITVSELMLMQLTSAVALQVIGSMHQFPVVIVAIMFYGESLSMWAVLGFVICFAGALTYMAARRLDARHGPSSSLNGANPTLQTTIVPEVRPSVGINLRPSPAPDPAEPRERLPPSIAVGRPSARFERIGAEPMQRSDRTS
eukprot:CAMPEP_0178376828 /NCGR_PEP_ID=MMETSP0689_2-20121128/3604_1 /TAXON_ID=160604 /ORGANISM="Amphidinium massartii, Strain CS-259" /LENGTH=462 /DNA_ID=CAMNT_0019996863 /DNA_START=25 /DNA_END=1410 /DNA_ORIENTATION=-